MNPHQLPSTSFKTIFSSFKKHYKLIFQMAQREVLSRYRGSVMGIFWSLFNPLLMLGVYTFFFSVVFKARWHNDGASVASENFVIVMFVGLIIHGMFAECINRAPTLISNNVSYVKKVVFPLEIFPWIALASALFHMMISIFILIILQFITGGQFSWMALLLPLILIPFLFFIMGVTWFLAATGVYIRDIGQTTGLITSVLLFMSPVFYPLSSLPPKVQHLVMLNPLTIIIESSRNVLLFKTTPNLPVLAVYFLLSLLIAWMGFWWFQKTRKGFADVI